MASDYDDGVAAGKIVERLDHHDRHFLTINGSVDRLGDGVADLVRHTDDRLAELALQVQRLADQAVARDATAVALAAALKDAEEVRRHQGEQKWWPLSRTIAVVVAIATVAGVVIALLSIR